MESYPNEDDKHHDSQEEPPIQFRKGYTYYRCLGGRCEDAIFERKHQIRPLEVFDVNEEMEDGHLEVDSYFNTGDFHEGFVICLPLKAKKQWLYDGTVKCHYPSKRKH